MHLPARGHKIAACCLFGAVLLIAQPDWKTVVKLPDVDFSRLSDAKQHALLRMLRTEACTCGCSLKVAECRVEDTTCPWSKGFASTLGDALRAGKNENDAIAAVKASRYGQGPQPGKVLEDAVKIRTDGSPVRGPENAPLTLVEFSDFQCPYCALAIAKLDAVLAAYPGKVKLIFKQFPLDGHPQAPLAAAAAIAAHQQGKFWQMHDALFAHHKDLSRASILDMARTIGLDLKRFQADWDSPETKKIVARDMDDGDHAYVEGTPSVYINGQKYNGSLELAAIRPYLDAELKKTK